MAKYINPYTDYRDLKSALETAVEDRLLENATNGILKGYNNNIIADLTGLTIEQIEKLRAELKKKNG